MKIDSIESFENGFEVGRKAFKIEVLKILNKHIQPIIDTQLQKEAENFIHLDAIKEIEKL